MGEIWCSDEKVGDWTGADVPKAGDKIPVVIDGDEYNATVKKVYKQHITGSSPTDIIEVIDPRPLPIA